MRVILYVLIMQIMRMSNILLNLKRPRSTMVKFVFLLPLSLFLLWYAYLRYNNYGIEDGKKGFIYIAVVSAFITTFFAVIWLVTR